MYAVCGSATRVSLAQVAHLREIAECDRGNNEGSYANGGGIHNDFGLRVAKFGGIQMAMRIGEAAHRLRNGEQAHGHDDLTHHAALLDQSVCLRNFDQG
jgi:hypothetical protein